MRVLFVSHGYPPFGVTGVERVTEQTAVALAGRHEVMVLSRRPGAAPSLPILEDPREQAGVSVHLIAGGAMPPHGPFPGYQERLERIFERLVIEHRPDVVVIAHLSLHSPRYVAIAQRWLIPVVLELHDFYSVCERAHLQRPGGELCDGPDGGRACHVHCFRHTDGLLRWGLRTRLFRDAVAQADGLVAPSPFVADYFARYTESAASIQVIPNGVSFEPSPSRPPSREGPLHLGSLGPVIPHKGAHVVVDALRRAALPAVRYTLFGAVDHAYMAALRKKADEVEGLALRGFGPYELAMLPALLGDVDAVVIPSIVWESFSIVAREAMACGAPVIASRLGALPEAVRDRQNGLLFGSRSELASILMEIDADREALPRLRAAIGAEDWISVEERARRLEELLDDVRARGRRSPPAAPPDAGTDLASLRSLVPS